MGSIKKKRLNTAGYERLERAMNEGSVSFNFINNFLTDDIELHDPVWCNKLFLPAIYWGHSLLLIKLLIEGGADVNQCNEYGTPALLNIHWHDRQGGLPYRELLINAGASINYVDSDGETPLSMAFEREDFNTAQLLIKAGADLHHHSLKGCSPLFLAIVEGSADKVQQLITQGASLGKNREGPLPLIVAAGSGLLEITQILLAAGADVNGYTYAGDGTLHHAVYGGHISIVKELIKAGANINEIGRYYCSILEAAIVNNQFEIVKILIAAGVDLNNNGGMNYGTPLQAALYFRCWNIAKELILSGADVNRKDANALELGFPLQLARQSEQPELVELLLKAGAKENEYTSYAKETSNIKESEPESFEQYFIVD